MAQSEIQEILHKHINIGFIFFFYHGGGEAVQQAAQRYGDLQNLAGHDPKQYALADPACAGG